jgi:antitoxin component of MazEF toxin-antitoxin module
MSDQFEEKGVIKVTIVTRVSAHGDGLYLYIPKDVWKTLGIMAGDKLEVQLLRHWKPPKAEEVSKGEA